MINWLLSWIPPGYSWGVAIKKGSYMAGKVLISLLLSSKAGGYITSHTTPDQVSAVQMGVTVAAGAILEGIHDWLKMKFPTASWL